MSRGSQPGFGCWLRIFPDYTRIQRQADQDVLICKDAANMVKVFVEYDKDSSYDDATLEQMIRLQKQ